MDRLQRTNAKAIYICAPQDRRHSPARQNQRNQTTPQGRPTTNPVQGKSGKIVELIPNKFTVASTGSLRTIELRNGDDSCFAFHIAGGGRFFKCSPLYGYVDSNNFERIQIKRLASEISEEGTMRVELIKVKTTRIPAKEVFERHVATIAHTLELKYTAILPAEPIIVIPTIADFSHNGGIVELSVTNTTNKLMAFRSDCSHQMNLYTISPHFDHLPAGDTKIITITRQPGNVGQGQSFVNLFFNNSKGLRTEAEEFPSGRVDHYVVIGLNAK